MTVRIHDFKLFFESIPWLPWIIWLRKNVCVSLLPQTTTGPEWVCRRSEWDTVLRQIIQQVNGLHLYSASPPYQWLRNFTCCISFTQTHTLKHKWRQSWQASCLTYQVFCSRKLQHAHELGDAWHQTAKFVDVRSRSQPQSPNPTCF